MAKPLSGHAGAVVLACKEVVIISVVVGLLRVYVRVSIVVVVSGR